MEKEKESCMSSSLPTYRQMPSVKKHLITVYGMDAEKSRKISLSDLIQYINFRKKRGMDMSYEKKYWDMVWKVEVEKRYPLRWGAPGMPREARKKPTPEQIERQNEWQAERELNRLITANFTGDDYHTILTFAGEPTKEEAKKCLGSFLRYMRQAYKKGQQEFKYIVVTEYQGKRIHHHLIINHYEEPGSSTMKLVKTLWKKAGEKAGNPKFVGLYDNGDYKNLAEYLIKETKRTFRQKDACIRKRWSCSRNLVRPEAEKETVQARCWRKEPRIPKGYYLEEGSLINGINPVTGLPYQHYTLVRLAPVQKKERAKRRKP